MKLSVWFIILLLCQTCATPKVIKFLNDELDYSKYYTYRLIHYKSDDKSYSPEGMAFFGEIEMAISQNMAAKGYEQADKPDLIARYEIVSTTVTESNTRNYDPYGYNNYYFPQDARKHTEGIILIELRDRKQKKLVWQGSLDLKYKMKKEVQLTMLESINIIFESYPYQAGSNERITSEK
ncbi:protein of unknown function [Reichenbachiella faecimaris]|uniref:DUF4136 domain-containing protein n=1 Tax=Reichenbachiella faecimaris TaxID=692418 RepID=A0A1W2GR60_REIFA|nr:DUF4136 domain-containing protein [Reichenbachiella faecimaris]SMD39129.1 protein of unknown function [Reichenbachiella faecimaris]